MTIEKGLNNVKEFINYLAELGAITEEEANEQTSLINQILHNVADDELTKEIKN